MAIRVYKSEDFSRLGIEIFVPDIKKQDESKATLIKCIKDGKVETHYVQGKTTFIKLKRGGKTVWRHIHDPGTDYLIARETFEKKFRTGCVNMSMGQWIFKKKKDQEEFDNRCAKLAARLFNHLNRK